MCKYCDTNGDDWKYITHSLDFGILGNYEINTAISQKYGMQIVMNEQGGRELGHMTIPNVKYCPYCGEPLSKQ